MPRSDPTTKDLRARIAAFRRSRRFVRWGESAALSRRLEELLADIDAAVDDPRQGAELLLAFYGTDKGTLGNCDDSSGHVGDVYRLAAVEVFVAYAARCSDKEWLAKQVLRVNRDDDFGVRDTLLYHARRYLPEPIIRTMIAELQQTAKAEPDTFARRYPLRLVEALARQVGDAALFAKTRLESWGKDAPAACADIAEVYLENGDPATALTWLERIPAGEGFRADERDRLLVAVHGQLGDAEAQADAAWRVFRRARSVPGLEKLLAVIGEDQRTEVLDTEAAAILAAAELSYGDAAFLVEAERLDDAERYLLDRAAQINGDYYERLLPLAEAMHDSGRELAAVVVFRALVDSILRRARSVIYGHAVRYLRRLERMAPTVGDWRGFEDHEAYVAGLRARHGQKRSFWGRVNDEGVRG